MCVLCLSARICTDARLYAAGAAVEGARDGAGLTAEMVAEVHGVDVLEDAQRHAPDGVLRHARKHRRAQLRKGHRGAAGGAISHHSHERQSGRRHAGGGSRCSELGGGEGVDNMFEEERDGNVDQLRADEQDKGGNHPQLEAWLIARPQVQREVLQDPNGAWDLPAMEVPADQTTERLMRSAS